MLQNKLQLTKKTMLVCLILIMMVISNSGASAAPQVPPDESPVLDVPAREVAAPAAQTSLEELSPADALGVQSISPSHFSSGGSTVKAAGANFVHFGLEWDDLAPTDIDPAAYDWTTYDAQMDLAASLGYEIMVTLGHNPLWAASFRRGPVDCVPLSRFTDYVDAVVTRYSAPPYNVKYWALYNEPDVVGFTRSGFTDCSGDSWAYAFGDDNVLYNSLNGPEHYAAHLQAAYTTIKAINPNAVVMNGGVAHDNFESEGGYFNEDFLDQIFTAGAASYMDAMNFHYYPEYDSRWESRVPGEPGLRAKTQWIRDIMNSYSVHKPMVISELGESSGFGGDDPRTQDTQAIAVIKQFTRSLSEHVKIGIWYNLNDYNGSSNTFEEHGLLDYPSFDPKLSLDAFETLATLLTGFEFTRVIGSTEMDATDLEGYLFWDKAGGEAMYVLWSADGSNQTITLPPSVTSVVDKFNDPITYSSTLDIDEQPVFITSSVTFHDLFLPLIWR